MQMNWQAEIEEENVVGSRATGQGAHLAKEGLQFVESCARLKYDEKYLGTVNCWLPPNYHLVHHLLV